MAENSFVCLYWFFWSRKERGRNNRMWLINTIRIFTRLSLASYYWEISFHWLLLYLNNYFCYYMHAVTTVQDDTFNITFMHDTFKISLHLWRFFWRNFYTLNLNWGWFFWTNNLYQNVKFTRKFLCLFNLVLTHFSKVFKNSSLTYSDMNITQNNCSR